MLALLALLLSLAPAPRLEIWFLDVGQGDAAVIRSPAGKWVLVDAGPPEAGRKISALLKREKAGPIDLLLLTHPHLDHLGGMARLLDRPGAKLLMDPAFPHPLPEYAQLLDLLKARMVPVKDAVAGRRVELGEGAALEILWPERPFLSNTRSDVNSASVVARLVYKDINVLFAGDAEREVEARLLALGAAVQARVLKVGHHGSAFASTAAFLKAVRPELAVVSVGKVNDYKQPAKETLERLRRARARVLRTDTDGDVKVTTDGETLEVATGWEALAERVPAADAPGAFVSTARSALFHRADCPSMAEIRPDNLLHFKSRAEAARGRLPAEDCQP